jgi:aspartate aminotransferase/aminotransferase
VHLADRVHQTDISGIRKVFDLAANLENPINLSIGQPDFDVPDPVKEAAARAIRDGRNSYTQTQGCRELREALLQRFGDARPEELLVTSAVSGGLTLAFLALLNPGDEVLVPDPYFVMYKQLPILVGATPVYYDTYPDWRIRPECIEPLITERTRAIVIGSPSNPTGVVYTREELAAVAELLAGRDIIAISDEIYELFSYDHPFASFREVYGNTLVLGGLSKSHAMTGWRVGWARGPRELIQAMTKFQQFTFVCAPAPAQHGAVAALETDMSPMREAYRAKRDRIVSGLRRIGYDVEAPEGAFYVFPRAPWGTDTAFVAACIGEGLLVIPGSVFSEKTTHFRISYAASDETIDRGLGILESLFTKPSA